MKRIDIFCASQASTAICLSMDQASCSSSNTIQLGGRVIDRHNPIINDSRRKSTSKTLIAPCSSSSQPPIEPKKKISSSTSKLNNGTKVCEEKKKSEAEKVAEHVTIKRRLVKPLGDSITPFGSTRSLLSHTPIFDGSSHYHQIVGQHESNPASKLSRSSCPISGSSDQVVVLRVSLHCKGCEGKVRKHLSRMEGVTSFNIDFAAKKVTVIGDVTPFSVLESISKVKNAQFWPPVGSHIQETKFK
ncbi:protein SODIUM POTASSIUM ROOT DEFECTIVE 2-like [Cicer arietinum]|uniref:Protein SODIUM POTASSIUM ROOT DEFECTIVE 2-like n=1 Tax=Cicer arietinum TaxID=3827 RepID=A0A1S2XV80_CICAR|nr:protein SODIUM POTASSIUM ROOT DEFECTIVE 2-like [Cicer arietinum]